MDRRHTRCTPVALGFKGINWGLKVELRALRSIRVGVTYFGVPDLEFSTLLEVTEATTEVQ